MTTSPPYANDVDRHVGARVAARRRDLGLSQSDLARAIGLTFQQVQKYERGANRISASKLWAIAGALNVDIQYFFEGLEREFRAAGAPPDSRMSALDRLSDRRRALVLALIRMFSELPTKR